MNILNNSNNIKLKNISWNELTNFDRRISLNKRNIIIVDVNDKYNMKLNAIVIDFNINYKIIIRYLNIKKGGKWWTDNKDNIAGLNIKLYNNYEWVHNKYFIENGCDDIIDFKKDYNRFYKSYDGYPFFNGNYNNIYSYKYFITLYRINKLNNDYIHTLESDTYSELPLSILNELGSNNYIRIKNNNKDILTCIIKYLPKNILNFKEYYDDIDKLRSNILQYIYLNLNLSFIKKICKKYNIKIRLLLNEKENIKKKRIINNNYIAILCSELFNIDIKIFRYLNNNIELINIMNDGLYEILIYNFNNIYELIINKNFYIKYI